MKITYKHFKYLQKILCVFMFVGIFYSYLKYWKISIEYSIVFSLLLFISFLCIYQIIEILRTTFGYYTPEEIEEDEKITKDLEREFKKLDDKNKLE